MLFVWPALAALFILYGLLVFSVGSGTGFYLVWFFFGACCLFFAYASGIHLWLRVPTPVKAAALVLLFSGIVVFLTTQVRILSCFPHAEPAGSSHGNPSAQDLDYLIVAGAQVYRDGPSVVLRYRLDTARDYLARSPETLCIVSGGQGSNEPFPEAVGMQRYLVAQGIDPERILQETQSSNTTENMLFSLRLLGQKDARVGIVTNNFHMYRALAIAKKAGIRNAYPVPSGSSVLFLPNNLLREFFGVIKDTLAGNM